MISKAARRYASAYLQTVLELDKLEDAKKDMELIHSTIANSRDLQLFLKSPIVRSDKKLSALTEIFESNVGDEAIHLITLLVKKKREALLQAISKGVLNLYNIEKNIIEVDVKTAYDLTKDQEKTLLQSLEKRTGKNVKMDLQVDESILGGVVIKIDDTVIDDSVKHKISQLKNQFAANAVS